MTLREALKKLTERVNVEIYIIDQTGAVRYKEIANQKDLMSRIEEYDGYEVAEIGKRKYTPYLLEIYLEKKGR